MANYVYIATSLDGYIATEDKGLDWLNDIPNPDNSDFGFTEFMDKMDALVMGRKTFDMVLSFGEWPYSKPVFVLSNSVTEVAPAMTGKAEFINGSPAEITTRLQNKGYANLYIDGGRTIQSFLRDDLIDELIITKLPVLLGGGIPLFASLDTELKFEHKETMVLNNYLVKSHYLRNRISPD
jgi:dihydrofolate reductase